MGGAGDPAARSQEPRETQAWVKTVRGPRQPCQGPGASEQDAPPGSTFLRLLPDGTALVEQQGALWHTGLGLRLLKTLQKPQLSENLLSLPRKVNGFKALPEKLKGWLRQSAHPPGWQVMIF